MIHNHKFSSTVGLKNTEEISEEKIFRSSKHFHQSERQIVALTGPLNFAIAEKVFRLTYGFWELISSIV